jgi:hypothetical protein
VTFTPAAATGCATAATISGWLPATATELGSPVFGKLGQLTKGGVAMNVLSAQIKLTNNIKYYDEEKNNSLYTTELGRPGKRSVEVTLDAYYYKEHAAFFYEQYARAKAAYIAPVGNVAGSIFTVYAPATGAATGAGVETNNPDISGDAEKKIKITGKSLASTAYGDELSLKYS